MSRQLFEYDAPERFVPGTVGEPGSRTFFLQATGGGRTTSVALEKQQVAVLAERLDEVLRRTDGTAPVPAVTPEDSVDNAPLDIPIVEEFRVGTMALAWDTDLDCVIVEAQALRDEDDEEDPPSTDDPDGPDLLRVRLTGAMARAFVDRARRVVAAGRPSCPFCSNPLDPEGHVCPRMNGYRR